MMFLGLLELWTVSVGILLAVWYILLSNTTGGVYLSGFTLIYLLLSWYLEAGNSGKSSDRSERSIGLWCSLLLPLVHMLSCREEDHFLPLTVSAIFVHYTWTKSNTSSIIKCASMLILLVQTGVSLFFGSAVLLLLFTPAFYLLYGAIHQHISLSFTLGERAIVSQLLSYFGYRVSAAGVQFLQGKHTDILEKTTAVIFVSVATATILFVCLKFTRQNSWTFYIVLGLVVVVIVIPSTVFIIKLDGIKTILRLIFKNKKSILLFLWWVLCTVASVYIVIFYGHQTTSSQNTSSVEQLDVLTSKTKHDSTESSYNTIMSSLESDMETAAKKDKDIFSCRLRKVDTNLVKECMEIRPENDSRKESSSTVQSDSRKLNEYKSKMRPLYVTTQVRKLFHLVMIVVYIPGLLCNTSALYLASVVALAVLILLEVIRVYKVPPLGLVLDQYFTVFLDRQDCGDLILTPLYLLIGCSMPLWFSHSLNGHADLKIYAGIVSTGIGDSAASLVGQKFGKHRWPDSKKTVEGTLGAAMSQLLAVVILQCLGVPGCSLSVVTVISVILISCLEAFSGHIDNLVVSLYAFMLFSTAGTFI